MGTVVHVQYYISPCGEIVLASVEDGLCLCDWKEHPCAEKNIRRLVRVLNAEFVVETSAVLEKAKTQLDEYFAGVRKSFDLPLAFVGTDFQKCVWSAILEIPYGETRSYKEIAMKVDNLKGVRAVAQAIGANGICIIVPCHRVIGSDCSLKGFAGGLEVKRILLRIEH